MSKSLLEFKMLDFSSFSPATSKDFPAGTIVLQRDYLTLPKDSKCGVPGIFQLSTDEKSLSSPSYNLATKGISFAGHDIVRCIITPASDITIIPCDLDNFDDANESGFKIEGTRYSLNSFKDNSSTTSHGYFTSVKLGLVLRSVRDLTQNIQIDGAILLDPKLPKRLPFEGRPVCLLGMDFITKYPYLLYVPRPDSSGTIDFVISRDLFASRPYSVHEQFYKTVIVHVDGHHDKDTGKTGYGVFFKSGSIFNMLSGVSGYDKAERENVAKLKERGILMAIIKALHVVRNFPIGRDFRGVIIRSTDPTIARLMAVTQITMKSVFTNSEKNDEDDFDPMEGGYYYPTANRDLMLYFCHTFLRKELGFKVTFEDSKICSEARAANILAVAASQMEEFFMAKQVNGLISKTLSPHPQTRPRETNKTTCSDIPCLENCIGLENIPLYISLGLDGYFSIHQKKAHEIMKAADLAGLNPEFDTAYKPSNFDPNEKLATSPKTITNTNKRYEKDINVVDIKKSLSKKTNITTTARNIFTNGVEKGLGPCKDELHREDHILKERGADLVFSESELGYSHIMKIDNPVLRRIEKRVHIEAKARISKAKEEGQYKYDSTEEQMITQIAQINDEGLEKHRNITKETDAKITATRTEFGRKREFIVSETRTRIDTIKEELSRSLELIGWNVFEEDTEKGQAVSKDLGGAQWAVNGKHKKFQPLMTSYDSGSE